MAKEPTIKELLTDPLHHIGWLLTTLSIIIVFHLLGVHGLHTPIYHILILHITVVVIDVIKHIAKLQ